MNFLDQNATADYALTGVWANKACKEAKLFGNVNVACDTKSETYSRIDKNLKLSDNATYLHITANNTIYGTEWHNIPKPKSGFLMADVSSDPVRSTCPTSAWCTVAPRRTSAALV